jgi:hypothetical protein
MHAGGSCGSLLRACCGSLGRLLGGLGGLLGASWGPLGRLLAPLGAPEGQREAFGGPPEGPLEVLARRGEFHRLCRRLFGSPLRRLTRRGPRAKSFFYDKFACFTALCDCRLRQRSAVFWCVSVTSRGSAISARTMGEVENYLVLHV